MSGNLDKCIFIGNLGRVAGIITATGPGKLLLYNAGGIDAEVTFAEQGDMFVDGGFVGGQIRLGSQGSWFDAYHATLSNIWGVGPFNCFSILQAQQDTIVHGDPGAQMDRWSTDNVLATFLNVCKFA